MHSVPGCLAAPPWGPVDEVERLWRRGPVREGFVEEGVHGLSARNTKVFTRERTDPNLGGGPFLGKDLVI